MLATVCRGVDIGGAMEFDQPQTGKGSSTPTAPGDVTGDITDIVSSAVGTFSGVRVASGEPDPAEEAVGTAAPFHGDGGGNDVARLIGQRELGEHEIGEVHSKR